VAAAFANTVFHAAGKWLPITVNQLL